MPLSLVHKRECTLFFPILHCTILTAIFSSKSDPLVHHGHHFCCTIHAMCNIYALLTQSVIYEVEQTADDDLNDDEHRKHQVFKQLLNLVPNLKERIMTGSEEELTEVADLLHKGATGARGDNTKNLNGNILEY
ncbi:hypothetical protein PILCRDRAFT_63295 [Piloderma croceum F 1598]|uniref:Uncharacterized protein n=1 Tax=Piloderma croceum (strain F 1598) TaxID=765440 RepID=A0A0C3BLI4_PILCF|nr:hypothetical protein PILCRDRAFT_63295 [Piloderma croceum F 1598]